jgi:hypothetical protein
VTPEVACDHVMKQQGLSPLLLVSDVLEQSPRRPRLEGVISLLTVSGGWRRVAIAANLKRFSPRSISGCDFLDYITRDKMAELLSPN